MATKTLIEKIEALPPEKKAEVESFVESLHRRAGIPTGPKGGRISPDLLRKINDLRETLRREHGLYDLLPLIREFRETGR